MTIKYGELYAGSWGTKYSADLNMVEFDPTNDPINFAVYILS